MPCSTALSSYLVKAAKLLGRAKARGKNSFPVLKSEEGSFQVKFPKRETKIQGRKKKK